MIKDYIKLARVHQYTKNLFVLAPLFFGFLLFDKTSVINSIFCFISFCLMASSIYIFNDMFDVESDILHPKKKHRPIASGKISKQNASIFMIILFVLGVLVSILSNVKTLYPILIYFVLNILYCVKLKHIAILDIFIIATGFVLRIFAGGQSISVDPSHWIIILTFLLAIFLALAKRRDDIVLGERNGVKHRISIDGYNKQFLDISMAISASLCLVSYILYSISEYTIDRMHSDKLYLTSIFVMLGIFRYMQITFVMEKSGSPSKIVLKDRFLQGVILCWLLSFCVLIYF